MNPEGFCYYICKHSVSNIVIKNNDEHTNIVFPGCVCSQHKEPRMYERSGRSCLKRTINVKAPGIMGEVLNLTKQSCTNTTTSKAYLRRKWRENRRNNSQQHTVVRTMSHSLFKQVKNPNFHIFCNNLAYPASLTSSQLEDGRRGQHCDSRGGQALNGRTLTRMKASVCSVHRTIENNCYFQ